jgi:PEP-CTERM motif
MARPFSLVACVSVLCLIAPAIVDASPITFDLRDPAIELIDEVNSFAITRGGILATLTAGNGFSFDNFIVTEVVPEPASVLLLGTGLLGTARRRRRIRRATDVTSATRTNDPVAASRPSI